MKPGMQVFSRERNRSHCLGAEWPEFIGRVEIGESFILETESCNPNGPVEVAGIKAQEPIAVRVEAIEIEGPFAAPNGGPFLEGLGPPIPLEYRDGYFLWPEHFRLAARPSVGNVAVLPQRSDLMLEVSREYNTGSRRWKNERGWRRIVRDPRGKHCHQDCAALTAGATIHMKACVDGAGLCMDDVHGYISQGELAFAGIEVAARVQVRVDRSSGWLVDWAIIETDSELLVFVSYVKVHPSQASMRYVDLVREAYAALRAVVAARIGGTIEQANSIVATAADLRNCVLYGLGEGYIPQETGRAPYDVAVVACLPKAVLMR